MFVLASSRAMDPEDRPRPSDRLSAVDYVVAYWESPGLDSVRIFARDDEAPSTQVSNYGSRGIPRRSTLGTAGARIQRFADAIGCDLPDEPPEQATELNC